ncbi:MAG: hypothetical protein AB7S70_16295 [Hyphomicrobium sp.]|uniref:hypothetical protein n=1 Tax=Hyphomicrobium sp. TaxID=82 RepID=UPI003D0B7D9E
MAAAIAATQAGCVAAVHDCLDGKGCRAMFVHDDEFVCRLPAPRAASRDSVESMSAALDAQERVDRRPGCQGGCVDLR